MPRKNINNPKRDCFGYVNDRVCNALNEMKCNKCVFYKTVQQYQKELMRYNGVKTYKELCLREG